MRLPQTLEQGGRTRELSAPPARSTNVRRLVVGWVLVRITGLLLAVLVLGHFALTHFITDVAETDAAFIDRRWSSALWLGWDWLMLAAALAHGATGVWVALADYTPDPAQRRRRQRVLITITVVLFVLGSITIAQAPLG